MGLLSMWADTVTIPRHRSPSRPSNGLSGTQLLKGRLVSVWW